MLKFCFWLSYLLCLQLDYAHYTTLYFCKQRIHRMTQARKSILCQFNREMDSQHEACWQPAQHNTTKIYPLWHSSNIYVHCAYTMLCRAVYPMLYVHCIWVYYVYGVPLCFQWIFDKRSSSLPFVDFIHLLFFFVSVKINVAWFVSKSR